MISYSLLFLPLFFESLSLFRCLPLMHPHTHARAHKHTHINSPLGVCCFHYLQLGPETAFRVEYSRAELARIAVYTERSLVIASSLFSLSSASGGKYESVVSGDHPCCAAPHLTTTVCPPTGTSNRGKTESLKASESPTTATLTIHAAVGYNTKKSGSPNLQQRGT